MESVAAERLNKIGIRDHNTILGTGSASDNDATSVSQDAHEMSAIVSALAQQQSEAEDSSSDSEELGVRHRSNCQTSGTLRSLLDERFILSEQGSILLENQLCKQADLSK